MPVTEEQEAFMLGKIASRYQVTIKSSCTAKWKVNVGKCRFTAYVVNRKVEKLV